MIFEITLTNVLANHALRLEWCVARWLDDKIARGLLELNCWDCLVAMYAPDCTAWRGLEELREMGADEANRQWRALFGNLCRERKREPDFVKKNASVGFQGPSVPTAPKQKAVAKPTQRIDYARIAAITRAMTNTPKAGGMGDMS
jgi:hypothetical protein